MQTFDVVIVGGGAMGSATAYHLLCLDQGLRVAVVERQPGYEHCSTLRSDGNLRVQFNLEENVRMSLHTLEILGTFADDMRIGDWRPEPDARHQGNLFLAEADARDAALEGVALQRSFGCEVEWLDADEIAARWPAFAPHEDVVGGVLGPRDGSIDPSAVLEAFRRNAVRLGATYLAADADELVALDGRVTGVRLADGAVVGAEHVVVAAGAWSTPLLAGIGAQVPVEPVMRTVHVVQTPLAIADAPSVFAQSGLYVLPEGGTTAQIAWSTDEDPTGFDFTYHRRGFEEVVWPELVRVLPAWQEARITSGWCGLYAVNTLDQNAILGAWPTVPGLWVATGFSGHGFQHTPAMGRHLAEQITGTTASIDLSRLGPQRILDGVPLREHAGRII